MKKITPEFRVSYPNVFKAQLNKLSGKEEYSITALFPKGADISVLKDAANAALAEKYGSDKNKWPKNLRSPFRDQADLKKDGTMPAGTEEGAIFVRFKSKMKPGVVDGNVQPILDPKEFYPGCYAKVSFTCYVYDQLGNKGVSFGLVNVQKTKDGEPLVGGTSKPEDDFGPIAGASEEANPWA